MKVVDLGVFGSFCFLVFVTVDSLGMVQIADCHWVSFLVGELSRKRQSATFFNTREASVGF